MWSNLISPPRIGGPRLRGGVATVAGITYGMVVIGDTSSTNFRDVKLPAGAASSNVRGVVQDYGDPLNPGQTFNVGDEFSCVVDGLADVLLDAGQTCVKDDWAITGATPGTVKPVGGEPAPYDFVGRFAQSVSSPSSSPQLVKIFVKVERRFA